jgi:prolyl oligopeptidase
MKSNLNSLFIAGKPVREVLHGVEVEDPFRWLEDQESPATRLFIEEEQRAYREYLNRHQELRSRIERRVRELLTVTTVDLPVPDQHGGLFYLKRNAEEEQKAIYYRDNTNMESLLLSVTMLGRSLSTSLSIVQVSRDGRYLVFGIRTGGEDVQEIGIYDLQERRVRPDSLPRGFLRGLVFAAGQRGFYYAHEETTGRYRDRRAIRWHEFGADQGGDLEIFCAEEGPAIRLVLQEAEDTSALGYLISSLAAIPRTRFLIHEFPLRMPPQKIFDLSGESLGLRFSAHAIVATTTHGAPLGRIVRIARAHPDLERSTDIIPETAECLYSWERWGQSLVIHYVDGSRKLTRVYSKTGGLLRTIDYPEPGTSNIGQVDGYTGRLFYSYSDITEPPAIYAIELSTGEHRPWWRQLNPAAQPALEVKTSTYPSSDGTGIPITLIRPRDAKKTGPILLCAYGGGGVSTTPKFSVLVTILAEAGVTSVTAHVRGGGEGGLEWHRAARRQNKQISVDDLVHGARWLIDNGYTTAEYLGVAGQSNGALLTLCAVTQHPELFRAALALGPITDLTRFHLFGVARGFVSELGSPENPDEFATLYRLSPYHHVRQEAKYPAVLIISGDRDKRCDSLHARKMIARWRAVEPKHHPILLDYTPMRGHKPVLRLAERIRGLTDRLTFLIAELVAGAPEAPLS